MRCCLKAMFHRLFIESLGFPILNSNSSLGAFPQAGTKTVTIYLTNELCLTVDNLKSPLRAGRNADATAIAFFFVNHHYLS